MDISIRKKIIVCTAVLILVCGTILPFSYRRTLTKASKQLIVAIKEYDLQKARSIVEEHPKCVNTLPTMSPYWWQVICEMPVCCYPLQVACASGNYDMILLLLDYGADCNLRWKGMFGDDTPLINVVKLSTCERRWEIVELLLDYGADVTLKNKSGRTAYDYAVENGLTDIAELLKP